KDPYALPADDASSPALLLYMKRLGRMQPEELTQEGFVVHFNKLDVIVDQLRQRDLDEDTSKHAATLKFEVLSILDQFGDESAARRKDQYLASLLKDERPALAARVRRFDFMSRMQSMPVMEAAERQQLFDDIAGFM